MAPVEEDQALVGARDRLVEALGRQAAFWGMSKIIGEIYAVLYLAVGPMSLGDLADELGVTKGNISIAIRTLEQLGMVRRSLRPGDRRVFFAAEPDLWRIMRRVLEQRQKPEFDESFRILEQGLRLVKDAPPSDKRNFVLVRMEALQSFYDELDQMVGIVLATGPRRFSRLVRVIGRLRRKPDRKGGDGK